MLQSSAYVTKEEIQEFLDGLKLGNYVKEHREIKTFVLRYMLKNPPGRDCVVQVGTFGKTTRSDTRGQNAHGLIISYVCPRLIPLVGDQLMQKRIGGHHVCCRYDGSTKQYVIQIQFNQSSEITDAPINAAKENMTDMLYHTDEYVTENEIDNFLDGLQIERLVKEHQYVSHAIRSILLDYMPVPNRSMQVTTIGKPPATSDNHETKEFGFYIRYQAQKTPAGDNNHPTSIRVGSHHIHGSYNPSIKEFVISVRFNNYNKFQDNSENVRTSILKSREEAAQAQKETKMNLEQVATELTEMGVTDFWAGMLRYLANEAGYSGEHDVKFEKLSDSVAVTFGECQGEMDAQRVVIEALNQDLSINTYTDGAVFLVPVTVTTLKKPTQQTKTQDCDAPVGKDMTAEEIGKVLLDTGVNQAACEETVRILIRKGFIRAIPNVSIARVKDKVDFIFGDYVVAPNIEPTEKGEMLGFVYSIWLPLDLRVGCFSYNIANQKETKMSNEQNATDTDLVWKKFREQLEAAKLSQQSIDVIVRTLRDVTDLKKPTAESVLLCTKSRNVTNVFYSHDGKHVTLTDAEDTYAFDDGETLSYGANVFDAFFISDTSKVKTFEEKMIHQHLGVPKVTLNLSNGNSIELPLKKEYVSINKNQVVARITCDVTVSLSNKVLNNLYGPALVDLTNTEKDRYFVNSQECTEEEVRQKRELWATQGIINPGAGSWADIE